MNLSYWELDTYFSSVDVLIVGSGIVGLNAAIALKEQKSNLKVLVIERGILPLGASSKNAGFSCFGSVSELLDDLENSSESEVFSLVEKRWKGLQRLRAVLGDKQLELNNWGGFELFDNEEIFEKCASNIDYLNKQVSSIVGSNEVYKSADNKINEFGFHNVGHLIENQFEGQIDTGKMISSLVRKAQELGVLILNSIEIKSLQDNDNQVIVSLSNGFEFNARKVIVATNGFAKQLLPELHVNPARAQVLITQPIPNLKIKGTFHYDKGYYYFRNVGNRLLLGGGRNLDFSGEETTEMIVTENIQNALESLLKEVILPKTDFTIDHRWSGIMGVGEKKTTIVKLISPNVACSVRMGGMGVAIGSLIGAEVADLILNS
jgi:gamma-glutamylputrescine oxidase